MHKIDLNCDLAESFGNYTIGNDQEILKYISSANVACGFHASDPTVMAKTVELAALQKVSVGAHPGFYDLMGFGRRDMQITSQEAADYVLYQIGALFAFCRSAKIHLCHIKLHGAFYNRAEKDLSMSVSVCKAVSAFDKDLIVLSRYGGKMREAALTCGLLHANEVFADRAYNADGSLVSRNQKGALIANEDAASARIVRMIKENKVTTLNGKDIPIQADSVCVHGDGSKALALVQKIRKECEKQQISIVPLQEVLTKN